MYKSKSIYDPSPNLKPDRNNLPKVSNSKQWVTQWAGFLNINYSHINYIHSQCSQSEKSVKSRENKRSESARFCSTKPKNKILYLSKNALKYLTSAGQNPARQFKIVSLAVACHLCSKLPSLEIAYINENILFLLI